MSVEYFNRCDIMAVRPGQNRTGNPMSDERKIGELCLFTNQRIAYTSFFGTGFGESVDEILAGLQAAAGDLLTAGSSMTARWLDGDPPPTDPFA